MGYSTMNATRLFSAMAMSWTMITNGLKSYKTMTFSKISNLFVIMKQVVIGNY